MSLRSVAKSLTGSLEDILSITSLVSDSISIAKSYMSEVKEEQSLSREVRMVKFKGEMNAELAEFYTEYKAKMYNLSEEYAYLNTEEVNNSIKAMLEDMGLDKLDK